MRAPQPPRSSHRWVWGRGRGSVTRYTPRSRPRPAVGSGPGGPLQVKAQAGGLPVGCDSAEGAAPLTVPSPRIGMAICPLGRKVSLLAKAQLFKMQAPAGIAQWMEQAFRRQSDRRPQGQVRGEPRGPRLMPSVPPSRFWARGRSPRAPRGRTVLCGSVRSGHPATVNSEARGRADGCSEDPTG